MRRRFWVWWRRVQRSAAANTYVIVDSPKANATVASSFVVGGWAIDQAARTDSGVSQLHVWAYPGSGAAPVFLGDITHGARPDVAASSVRSSRRPASASS